MDQLPQQTSPQGNPVVRWICNIMIAISAVALAVMMVLSNADIVGRAFMHPIEGTSELVGMLLIITSALGFGYCQLTKGNVSIDIVTSRLGRRGGGVTNIISYLMSIACCGVIVWQETILLLRYMSDKLGSTSSTLGILLWPFYLIIVVGFAWVGVIFILDLRDAFKEVFKK